MDYSEDHQTPTRVERHSTQAGAPVVTVTFANNALNLFDSGMFESLMRDVDGLVANPPRAVLIRAEGKVVSAGVDVHTFEGLQPEGAAVLWRDLLTRIVQPLENLPCPIVFAAHGLTLTAAFEIALACDIILASPAASFGLVETVVGLTPSIGGPQRLAERAGSGRSRELVMTGNLYSAETLYEWGVVNAIHTDVDAEARLLTDELADGPTCAHAGTKQIVAAWRSGGIAHADGVTPEVSAALFQTADLINAVQSFLAAGPGHAVYHGR